MTNDINSFQKTNNWEERFKAGDVPWEEDTHSVQMQKLFELFIPKGSKVLEVGCGYGVNANWLAENGYLVDATDISESAIQTAIRNSKIKSKDLNFYVLDFLTNHSFNNYQCLFDKGVLHSFSTKEGLRLFSESVFNALSENGYWINISGSAENPDPPGHREKYGYPRLTKADIEICTKDLFEIKYIDSSLFGPKNHFLAWNIVFRKL